MALPLPRILGERYEANFRSQRGRPAHTIPRKVQFALAAPVQPNPTKTN